jgi:predicted dehydrogenase
MAVIGAGGMARHHLRMLLAAPAAVRPQIDIAALCEPSAQQYALAAAQFAEAGAPAPAHLPDVATLLRDIGNALDAVFIITPHVLHHDQAVACMEAGLDVLLEKPMVMNAAEARSLIAVQKRTGRLLVVAFNGSLSPQVRKAAALIASRALGELVSISATVWQSWRQNTHGTWRQDARLSGGGFLFDTGAHMLNTVCDVASAPIVEVTSRLEPWGAPVDIAGVVLGRMESGALVTMHASGQTAPVSGLTIGSEVRAFCTQGHLLTGVWGERLLVQRPGENNLRPQSLSRRPCVWEQFVRVRRGRLQNPSPPAAGLRMALLWDAIQLSSARGGTWVDVER